MENIENKSEIKDEKWDGTFIKGPERDKRLRRFIEANDKIKVVDGALVCNEGCCHGRENLQEGLDENFKLSRKAGLPVPSFGVRTCGNYLYLEDSPAENFVFIVEEGKISCLVQLSELKKLSLEIKGRDVVEISEEGRI